jgi:hypothetical protein
MPCNRTLALAPEEIIVSGLTRFPTATLQSPPNGTPLQRATSPAFTRRAFAVAIGLAVAPVLRAADYFEKAKYFERQEGSDKPKDLDGKLMLNRESKRIVFFAQNTSRLEIPLESITNIVYERAKRPRYGVGLIFAWPLLFTKTKKHYLTIQFKDAEGQGQYALFQLDKGNYREVLAALEAASGTKVERLEEN